MSTTRFGTLLGLALGAVWAVAGFAGAAIAAVSMAVAWLVTLVLEGRVDLAEYLGHRHERD